MSLVNCDGFYQNKHLFVHKTTSSGIVPMVLPISGELMEWVDFCQYLDGYIIEKGDIAVCASDCLQNCPAPASAPIHHHLSTSEL